MFAKNTSVSTLLVSVIVAISYTQVAFSQFGEIDITKVSGSGAAVKAAAERACSASLPAQELLRRHRLGEAAEISFFNPRILAAFNNPALTKALNCQKDRNKVMKDVCELQGQLKLKNQCEINDNTRQVQANVANVDKNCAGADPKLFVTVTGITTGAPFQNPRVECGAKKDEKFTTTFGQIDISKTIGGGDRARVAALQKCPNNLSPGELKHRGSLAAAAESGVFSQRIASAGANAPLVKALTCQKAMISVLKTECILVADRIINRSNSKFQIDLGILRSQRDVDAANTICRGADTSLFR